MDWLREKMKLRKLGADRWLKKNEVMLAYQTLFPLFMAWLHKQPANTHIPQDKTKVRNNRREGTECPNLSII